MSLALLQRFGPLLSLSNKLAGELTDTDLGNVATALGGQKGLALLPLLTQLRDGAPEVPVMEILGSDQARSMYEKLIAKNEEEDSILFAKCPCCGALFETNLKG